jgi:hypothetical protein
MSLTSTLLSLLLLAGSSGEKPLSLPTIQERWDASDLVCIGEADSPQRTGVAQFIDGANRDQLSANVELEKCFKGKKPSSSEIRVLGNYVAAAKPGDHGVISFAYSGPPTGFVHNGRNLLFLRRTTLPDEFVVTVPVYESAIPFADVPPAYPSPKSLSFIKTVMTSELESAMLQSEDTSRDSDPKAFADPLLSDCRYIDYSLDYLGTPDGIRELSRFSEIAPVAIQRDIAVRLLDFDVNLLDHDQTRYESSVISLLLDETAPTWKRGNAALVLGRRASQAALEPLRKIVLEPAKTEQLQMLHNEAASSLESLEHRVESPNK